MLINVKRQFYTVKELRQHLGGVVTTGTIYKCIRNKEIPAVKFGTKILVPASWVRENIDITWGKDYEDCEQENKNGNC